MRTQPLGPRWSSLWGHETCEGCAATCASGAVVVDDNDDVDGGDDGDAARREAEGHWDGGP